MAANTLLFYHYLLIILLASCSIVASSSSTTSTISTPLDVAELQGYFGGVNHEAYLSWFNDVASVNGYTASAYFPAVSSTSTQSTTSTTSSTTTSSTTTSAVTDKETEVGQAGAALHWKLDETHLHIAVAVRSNGGWVGFGLADAGGMKGSDIVYFEPSKPNTLTDAYATDKVQPSTDNDCQDWIFVSSQSNSDDNGFVMFEGRRLLHTGDVNDHVIQYDADIFMAAQRVIFAWGSDSSSDSISYHTPGNVARGGLHWYGNTSGDDGSAFRQRMNATADGYFDVRAINYTLQPVETDYVTFCFVWSDFVMQGVPANGTVSLVGIEMILDEQGGQYVHHATFNGRRTPPSSNDITSQSCVDPWRSYDYPLYAWAPGTYPFIMPDGIGFTLGPDNDGIQGFIIEVHYHNPNLVEDAIDNGGLRLWYSHTPVVQEMGIMYLGDSLQNLKGTPIGNGLSDHAFECHKDCSRMILTKPVTVFQEYLHMHAKGVAAVQTHYRNGVEIRQAKTNFYDFDQAGIHNIRQASYTVEPGDSFSTHCFFADDDDTVFGKGSTDEMCFGALVYYPAQRLFDVSPWVCTYDIPLAECNASYSRTISSLDDTSYRTFGVASTTSTDSSGEQCAAADGQDAVAATDGTKPASNDSSIGTISAAMPRQQQQAVGWILNLLVSAVAVALSTV